MSAEEPETEAGAANDATEVVDDDFSTRLRNVAGGQAETQEAWSDEDDADDDASPKVSLGALSQATPPHWYRWGPRWRQSSPCWAGSCFTTINQPLPPGHRWLCRRLPLCLPHQSR